METKTITIKSVEKTSGTKNDNTEWHRISIKATDGKWYSSFSPLNEDALKEGAELKLQVIPSKIANTFEIKKLLEYSTDSARQGAGEGNRSPTGSHEVATLSAQMEQADSYARELMERAIQMAHEKTPEWEETSEYPYLIAVLIQTMHAKLTSDRIALQEAEKLKAYGNKRW
jgi:hypothetical protein